MSVTSQITLHSLLILGVFSVSACPGSSDGSRFEGTWTYNSGSSAMATCPTGSVTLDATGNEEFREGTDSDLVVISSDGCNIKLNASGNHADAVPGQTCTTLKDAVTTATTFNSVTFTITGDVLGYSAAGTIGFMGPGGEVTCTFAASATLHKVSK
jgi:hypothetical protein